MASNSKWFRQETHRLTIELEAERTRHFDTKIRLAKEQEENIRLRALSDVSLKDRIAALEHEARENLAQWDACGEEVEKLHHQLHMLQKKVDAL